MNQYALRRAPGTPTVSFAAQYPAVVAWLNAKAATFDFARSLREYLAKHGELTDGQLAAAQRCMLRDQQRDAERAQNAARVTTVNLTKIQAAFDRAKAAAARDGENIKHLGLRLDTLVITVAPLYGRNAGALYVKRREGNVYLGKIVGTQFMPVAACTETDIATLATVAEDPEKAALAYGLRWKECSCCGRELTNPVSRARGIGPICWGRYFG
jgi:hypothetical protein